jgi:hypothetical protein
MDCRAVPSDHQQTFRNINAARTTDTIKSLASRFGNGHCETFPSKLCELFCEFVGLFVIDVQAHRNRPFYHRAVSSMNS